MRDEPLEEGSPREEAGTAPVVEENGPWFGVFMTVIVFLFAVAAAAVAHSLLATFG